MSAATGVQISIDKVAAVDVGGKTPARIRTETTARDGASVPDIFDEYVNRVAMMDDKGEISIGVFQNQPPMEQALARMSDPNYSLSNFENMAAEVAVELNDRMESVSAPSGTLFISQVTLSGQSVPNGPIDTTLLLKMDKQVVQLLYRDSGNLNEFNQDEVYPEASRIQKAAISPLFHTQTFRRTGDVKIYDSSDSEYFREFLQCDKIGSSLDQYNALSSVISGIRRADGNGLINQSDISSLNNLASQNNGMLIRSDMVQYIDSITSSNISQNSIESDLEDEGIYEIDTDNASNPENFKYVVNSQGDSIDVKVPLGMDNLVDVQRQGGQVTVTIDGNDISKETKG